ncbi:MAG: protein phosphatase 2C domain-containing protein [Deltaproteobacteria bacterium]|nr:protein phosphatase 2C domain-containing protein [Deltaproteobacteria bacterium]
MRYSIEHTVLTDVGQRRNENQDAHAYATNGKYELFIVADGMGGARGGATASTMATNILSRQAFTPGGEITPESLRRAMELANHVVYSYGTREDDLSGMGTTLVALATDGVNLQIAFVGDSRIYLIRKKCIFQLSKDHTLIQELIESGALNEEEGQNHPISHMLTRSLGPTDTVNGEIVSFADSIEPEDIFILCSDGLYNMLSDVEISEIAMDNDVATAAQKLVAEANKRGGVDNITVRLIKVLPKETEDAQVTPLKIEVSRTSEDIKSIIDFDNLQQKMLDFKQLSAEDETSSIKTLSRLPFSEMAELPVEKSKIEPAQRILTEEEPNKPISEAVEPEPAVIKESQPSVEKKADIFAVPLAASKPLSKPKIQNQQLFYVAVTCFCILGGFLLAYVMYLQESAQTEIVETPLTEESSSVSSSQIAMLDEKSLPMGSESLVESSSGEEETLAALSSSSESAIILQTSSSISIPTEEKQSISEALSVSESSSVSSATSEIIEEDMFVPLPHEYSSSVSSVSEQEVTLLTTADLENFGIPASSLDRIIETVTWATQTDMPEDDSFIASIEKRLYSAKPINFKKMQPIYWSEEQRNLDALLAARESDVGPQSSASQLSFSSDQVSEHQLPTILTKEEKLALVRERNELREKILDIDAKLRAFSFADNDAVEKVKQELILKLTDIELAYEAISSKRREIEKNLSDWRNNIQDLKEKGVDNVKFIDQLVKNDEQLSVAYKSYKKSVVVYQQSVSNWRANQANNKWNAKMVQSGQKLRLSHQLLQKETERVTAELIAQDINKLIELHLIEQDLITVQERLNRHIGFILGYTPIELEQRRLVMQEDLLKSRKELLVKYRQLVTHIKPEEEANLLQEQELEKYTQLLES